MKDFNELTLADVALNEKGSIISGPFGSNISSKFFVKQGVPVIRGNNLTINNKSKFIDSDFVYVSKEKAKELNCFAICEDIIFTAAGTIGQVGIIEKNSKYQSYVISNKQMRVRLDKRKVNPYYVYYWLSSSWVTKGLIKKNTGSTVPLINLGIIKSIKINLPKERYLQDNIANLLNNLDKKIELNNRINAELEAMAKTLYDYWFVQFDFPNEEGKPYKSSGGKMVYNSILKREIPLGWKTESILNNCNIIDCLHSKKPDLVWESENYYLLQLENILDNGLIDISEKYYVSQKDYFIWTSRIELKQHDIVMTNAGRTAAFAQIPNHINCGIGRNITAIRPINISPNYFFLSLSSIDIQRQILTSLDNGAFFKSFNVRGIKALQLLRPINKIEHKFEDTIKGIIDKRNLLVKENFELKKLRDWLLPMLMNGQVTVK